MRSWAGVALGCGMVWAAEPARFELGIAKGPPVEVSWIGEAGFSYAIEYATNLAAPAWQSLATNLPGNGARLSLKVDSTGGAARYYRGSKSAAGGAQISPQAVDPLPGVVYPGGTILGSPLLGLQYTIPAAWKGGMRTGTSSTLFASDTEAGLVLGFLTLAGDGDYVARGLNQDFQTQDGYFALVAPPAIQGGKVIVEWQLWGQGIVLRMAVVLHPSGGGVGFGVLFTEANRTVSERVLADFAGSTVTAPRQTRGDLISLIAGKSFTWAKSSSAGNGGSSGSLSRWTENNAFFCGGTYEITTRSESSYSGNLSGGGFYTGGSSSSSTEAGDWTIIDTPAGPGMVLLSSSGVQSALIAVSGNTVYFGDQEFAYRGPHFCP